MGADEMQTKGRLAAIYYHPDAYTTSGRKIMGRFAAGKSFLRGFAAYSTAGEFWAQVTKPEHGRRFAEAVKASGRPEAVNVVDASDLAALSRPGVVYLPARETANTPFTAPPSVMARGAYAASPIPPPPPTSWMGWPS